MSPHPELFDDCRLVRPSGELDLTTTPDCRGRDGWIRVVHTGRGPGLVLRAVGLPARFPHYANVGDAWLDVPADCTAMARDT
ncbi:anti-sigma B factor antagonist [Streptomyces canus]|uniref:hypothetical protein n=1 Tax=Streptomyces canus TaxID=58343 RepID=UPI002786634A|nr:hypothetical protein [Streptomyces canus]MDQ0600275.1 anti-sigma B factor antagonist [Streptomyces canus]